MAISEDQRAILELLLDAGESYGEIAETIGFEPGQVRAKAHEALGAMNAPRIAADEEYADLLLGQLEPIGAQEGALERMSGDREALVEARRVAALLKLLAPGAQVPNLPRPETPPRAPRDAAAEAVASADEPVARDVPAANGDAPPGAVGLDRGQKKLLAALLGAGFVVIAIVLGVSGALGGGDDGNGGAVTAASSETTEAADGEGSPEEVIRAVLRSPGEGEAAGEAVFGSVDDAPALQVVARGLAPSGRNDEYNIWLYRNDEFLLRLDGQRVDEDGVLISQIELPVELLNMVVNGQFSQVDVSRADVRDYRREFNRASSQGGVPGYVGRTVLRGPITGPGLTDAAAD